jgi:C-terminal processing protease CtpA/Prc
MLLPWDGFLAPYCMKLTFLALGWALLPTLAAAQAPASFNLDMEQVSPQTHRPTGWQTSIRTGAPSDFRKAYELVADSLTRHGGRYALRLKSTGQPLEGDEFGVTSQHFPASFQGKMLKLTGYLKTDNVQDGYAGLWMRVDGPAGTLAFDNMQKRPIKGTTDWQQYTISLPLDEEAQTIYIGGLLPATGTMWLDDLTLTLDDKPLAEAKPKAVARYKADQDTAFRHGSGLTIDNLSKQQIENLAVLGRVWGFAKYYHPAVARGDYNWDAELLRVLPKVLASKDLKARSEVLGTWLTGLGPVPACRSCREPDSTRLQPDLAWLGDKSQLSPALSQQLVYLRRNRSQGPNYYVRPAPSVGNPIFTHEEAYASPATPDDGLRLLALFRYWNMIDYYFPYRYAIGEDWQRVLPEFIPQFVAARSPEQYRLTALALIARIHDTHANVFSDKILSEYKGNYQAPLWLRFVEGQATVAGYYDAALGAASTLKPGDVIVQVDGQPVTDIVKARQPITPASNEPTQLRNVARDLLRGSTAQVALVVRRAGREFPVSVGRVPMGQLNQQVAYGTPDPQAPAWKLLPGNIGYLALGTIKNADLPGIMDKAKGTKGLVIDIRNYPSEFVVFTLSKYLLDKPQAFVRFSQLDPKYPGFFNSRTGQKVVSGPGAAYPGKVMILIDEISQSQAEYTTMALRTAPRATVVGSTTAGADGNVSSIVLPGNIRTAISGLGIYYPDGRETQRVGIVPDVEAKPTIKGITEGRDEVLEKAVQLIEAG